MIIMPIKEGENMNAHSKNLKENTKETGVLKELRRRQYFTKPSITARENKLHAIYVEQLKREEE